jgi:hypothetical protein
MTFIRVGAELFHVDRQTDRHDEANICSGKFVNASKNPKEGLTFIVQMFSSLFCTRHEPDVTSFTLHNYLHTYQ